MSDLARSTIYQLPWLTRGLIRLGSILVNLLCATLRYKVIDEAGFLDQPFPRPVVILVWHNRILAMPVVFRRYYPKRKGLLVLTSASRDGAYLSELVSCFGMGAVRAVVRPLFWISSGVWKPGLIFASLRMAQGVLDTASVPVLSFSRKDAGCL
jgi:hypothetical protein